MFGYPEIRMFLCFLLTVGISHLKDWGIRRLTSASYGKSHNVRPVLNSDVIKHVTMSHFARAGLTRVWQKTT